MATQSLYRRYRPQRFSEVRGQEHVVKALRNAVVQGKEGQAYLFSGPRGTGKTTSARILAKVLNCERPIDGEPCCECTSCVAVQSGTSFDVHELDAASNNGVEAMRELIERTKLGTPGRHKVYILDEVHMLSKGAEAALLKTLEEPPPHVVFVLATTDPQKVSDTIRSRTQHLQFHLLPIDVLDRHVRWLAEDAGLHVTDDAIDAVLRRGGGSARDTISALELIAASGGDAPDETPLDEFVEAIIDTDPGRALTAVASSVHLGRDPRTLTEALVGHFRDCFLALMAPELVALPDARAQAIGELARRLGAAGAVRGIETLGSILVEMRHAPDARVLLEVALVKLSSPTADAGVAGLTARLERLERQIASGGHEGGGGNDRPARPEGGGGNDRPARPERPNARDDRRPPESQQTRPNSPTEPAATAPPAERAVIGSRFREQPTATPTATAEPDTPPTTAPVAQPSAEDVAARPADEPATPAPAVAAVESDISAAWSAAIESLKPIAKARFSQASLGGLTGSTLDITFPSDGLRLRGEDARPEIEAALSARLGRTISLRMSVGEAGPIEQEQRAPQPAPDRGESEQGAAPEQHGQRPARPRLAAVEPYEDDDEGADAQVIELPPADEDVDLTDLVDAPPVESVSAIDRLASHFPGAELIEGDR